MKLTAAALQGYSGPAQMPRYDRSNIRPGIVHLGIGAFHRAHQAVYVDDALESDPNWGIRAFSLRRPDTRDALMPQDGLYTLVERGTDVTARVIGSVLSIEQGADAACAAMADAATRLVTLTVTEKGYTPALAGVIVRALDMRATQGAGPLTILSCDNLSHNGQMLEGLVTAAAQAPATRRYIDTSVAFPSCMVDRITPATTDADRTEVADLTGLQDAWPIVTEPFTQWVIEDRFAGDRPPLRGVDWVADVAPYEQAKLWLLNGAHTTLAMLGPMLGHRFVADAVGDPVLRTLVDGTARREVIPRLSLSAGEMERYWAALMDRFDNPSLHHALAQIAMDTSQKLPQRLVAPLMAGGTVPGLTLAIAAWVTHVRRADRAGEKVSDPLAGALIGLGALPVGEALVQLRLGPLSALDDAAAEAVAEHLRAIDTAGPEALRAYLAQFNETRNA